jgi:hypothetical protein
MYGGKFYANLRHEISNADGLSKTSIRYAKQFDELHNQTNSGLLAVP